MRVCKARAVQRNNDAKSKQRERFDFCAFFFADTLNSFFVCFFLSLSLSLYYNISSLSLSLSLSFSLSLCLVVFILCLNSLLFFFVETRRRGGIAEVFIVFAERVGGDFTDVPRGERG